MIKKLRTSFILICMVSVSAIILVVLGIVNVSNYVSVRRSVEATLEFVAANDGVIPEDRLHGQPPGDAGEKEPEKQIFDYHGINFSGEAKYKARYFYVRYSADGEAQDTCIDNIATVSLDEAVGLANSVYSSENAEGRSGSFFYKSFDKGGETLVIFLECTAELGAVKDLAAKSLIIALAGLIILFVIIACLAPLAIRPFAQNMEKQKQFITDAGHEIKTPLAIISANADVLTLSGSDNEWVKNIKHQTERLSTLVNNLVMLSKLDETGRKLTQSEFSLSRTVKESAEQFETLAEIEGKTINAEVQPDLTMRGDENAVGRLIFILLDNGVKYSVPEGEIRLTLKGSSKAVTLTVFNRCENISKEDMKHLFDRFYRADKSRSRETGGYGIGLSLAKAIAQAHGGSITATAPEKNSVMFTVTMKI